jgi:endonuclease YncB( thermonuclease family)
VKLPKISLKIHALYIIIALIFNALPAIAEMHQVVCSTVHDGDTITIVWPDGQFDKVRLADIDCPEINQDMGWRAHECTRAIMFPINQGYNLRCWIDIQGRDRYGRLLATVFAYDGLNLNQHLVDVGLAWAYTKYSVRYKRNEQIARSKHLGIWSSTIPPEAPWDYRKEHKHVFYTNHDAFDGQ